MDMKLQNIEFIKLLPAFMRKDADIIGMSKGVDEIVRMFTSYGDHMSEWTAIGEMTEAELDELAWELNIPWYEPDASVEVKRQIVMDSDLVQQKLGTKQAVEVVISTYFGNGNVTEWFEYGGDPGHFKIESGNPSVTNENMNKFLRILEKVKRKSAHLDEININLMADVRLHAGVAYHEIGAMTVTFAMPYTDKLDANAGVAYHEANVKTMVLVES